MAREVNVSFIGAGNVAWHLAPALDNVGYVVKEVYSRHPKNAEALTGRLYQAEVKATLDFSTSPSSLFILCVSDDALKDMVREIILPDDAFLIHTSGSQPLSELQYSATPHIGVLYPLQTFTKAKKIDFKDVPIFIESSDVETETLLLKIGKSISQQVRKITSHERKALHVAAVFASNFTNHMITLSEKVMVDNGLKFEWLKPLILETIQKSLAIGPQRAQTGPAVRGDLEILDQHIAFLQDDETTAELYRVISQHILDQYHE